MNKILDILNPRNILQDKKKMIIAGAVIFIIILLIISRVNKGKRVDNDFSSQIEQVFESDSYSLSGDITISGQTLTITSAKTQDNKSIDIKYPDKGLDYKQIAVVSNNVFYLNNSYMENGQGLWKINVSPVSADEKNPVTDSFNKVLYNTIKNMPDDAFTVNGNNYSITITGANWETFFSSFSSNLSEAKDAIVARYSPGTLIGHEIDEIVSALKKLSTSTNSVNNIIVTLTAPEEENGAYSVMLDASIDFEVLPDFIKAEDLDSNKFTVLGNFTIAPGDAAVPILAGSVVDINDSNIHNFIVSVWDSMFKKSEYRTINEVTVKSDSVVNVISLGDVTETYQYLFDSEGISKGVLIVSGHDYSVISDYYNKYVKGVDEYSNQEIEIVYTPETKSYVLSIPISKSGLESLKKIAVNSHDLGEFLKTAKGVVPIV